MAPTLGSAPQEPRRFGETPWGHLGPAVAAEIPSHLVQEVGPKDRVMVGVQPNGHACHRPLPSNICKELSPPLAPVFFCTTALSFNLIPFLFSSPDCKSWPLSGLLLHITLAKLYSK